VDRSFARFNRNWCDRIPARSRNLGCAPDRVLIMARSDRALRIILTLLCVIAIVPVSMTALAQVMRLEARNSYQACQKAIARALRCFS
jgi:hypothetical protein